MSNQTPSQTIGPFFHIGMLESGDNVMVNDETRGQRILLRGKVFDGNGDGISDSLLEIWQADTRGIFPHPADPLFSDHDPNFGGYGRAATDDNGEYFFKTIMPGAVEREGSPKMAPHLNLRIFARGVLIHTYTRVYFPDDPANKDDPVLSQTGDRRETLIAIPVPGEDLPTYRFDVIFQGEKETVFFDF
jgi:protocatechuate 3,4-dioxygenase alpha subunit